MRAVGPVAGAALDHPLRQQSALERKHADAAALGQVDDAFRVDEDPAGRGAALPFLYKSTIGCQDLDAVVGLAVDGEQAAIGCGEDIVGEGVLSGAGAGAAPSLQQLAVGGQAMQIALAVAVGDHQFAGGVADDAGRLVEGLAVAALCMGRADGLQQLAAGAEDAQSVIAAIGDVYSVCRVDPYFVRQREDVLTPGRDEMPVAVVDDDGGIGLAVDDIDAVLRVGGDAGGDAQGTLGAPAGDGLVAVVPSTDDHGISLRFFRVIFAISDRLPALA